MWTSTIRGIYWHQLFYISARYIFRNYLNTPNYLESNFSKVKLEKSTRSGIFRDGNQFMDVALFLSYPYVLFFGIAFFGMFH